MQIIEGRSKTKQHIALDEGKRVNKDRNKAMTQTTSEKPPHTCPELQAAWDWSGWYMKDDSLPPWVWYELMKLRDAVTHLRNDMELPKRVFAKVEEVK